MIGVLNDRHNNQASAVNSDSRPPSFGNSKLRNMDILETTWEDESTEMVFKKRPHRLSFNNQFPSGLGRRPRVDSHRNIP
jgi:hypothetical protein